MHAGADVLSSSNEQRAARAGAEERIACAVTLCEYTQQAKLADARGRYGWTGRGRPSRSPEQMSVRDTLCRIGCRCSGRHGSG